MSITPPPPITTSLFAPLDLYCERLGPELWAEPFNALSNIFMFLVGAYFFLFREPQDRWLKLFGALAMLTGLGSFLFHTTAQVWSMFCDVIPIYLFILFYAYFSLTHIAQLSTATSRTSVLGLIGINAALEVLLPKGFLNGSAPYLPAFFMLAFVFAKAHQRKIPQRGLMGISLLIFGFSLTARTLDQYLCELVPTGTHFIWHTLNGLLLLSLIKAAQLTIQNKTPHWGKLCRGGQSGDS